ncbi:hypothetical protein ACSFA7_22640 [Variovorax sp. LT1R20]|uniref:hypothetical protein n=1 Tax=Variovorax sp. LT1R20 TaxID=3443729 RepID=UPI003F46EC72
MTFADFIASTRASIAARERRADQRWLRDVIAGRADLLSAGVFPRMEPLFAKYDADPEMSALLERAANAYADFAVSAACWALASGVIEDARRSARGP